MRHINIITVCWLAFVIFWIVSWSWSKPVAERQSRRGRRFYLLLLFIGFTFLWNAGSLASVYPLNIRFIPYSKMAMNIADALAVISISLAIWARATLGSNWSASVQIKENHQLVTNGPYNFIRHPIYTAMLGLFLATSIALGTVGGFVGFPFVLVGCLVKLKHEESFMSRQFPNQYPDYKKRTRMLIPFLW